MSIPQEVKYRAKTIAYAEKYGVVKATANYHTSEKNIYRWRKILKENDGNILSLENKSRRSKPHPNEHTKKETKKDIRLIILGIRDMSTLFRTLF